MENLKKKNTITINGLSIYRIFAYFIIYSCLGYIIEMGYSVLSKGTLESRQSFLYGPFCGIYGLGAVIMITCMHRLPKKNGILFVSGFVIGTITEYLISFLGETFLGVQWWDYSSKPFNLNGRVCIQFSIFWGVLAVVLMASINPYIDKLIEYVKKKYSNKALKIILILAVIILLIDYIVSMIAVTLFHIRMIVEKDIEVEDRQRVEEIYKDIYGNPKLDRFIKKYWGDRKMIRTYPNLKMKDINNNIIYFDSLLPGIQAYYYKFEK